jgi:hypothetical protein
MERRKISNSDPLAVQAVAVTIAPSLLLAVRRQALNDGVPVTSKEWRLLKILLQNLATTDSIPVQTFHG